MSYLLPAVKNTVAARTSPSSPPRPAAASIPAAGRPLPSHPPAGHVWPRRLHPRLRPASYELPPIPPTTSHLHPAAYEPPPSPPPAPTATSHLLHRRRLFASGFAADEPPPAPPNRSRRRVAGCSIWWPRVAPCSEPTSSSSPVDLHQPSLQQFTTSDTIFVYLLLESGFCHAIFNGKDEFEFRHRDQKFTVNLAEETCSCRYWQLSDLPCPHAIACIHFKTNRLDEYISFYYPIDEFNKTYEHYLYPLEGMHSWPKSVSPPPKAPKYVKMPGRPNKSRRREPYEKPKATRVSKVGTIIRCGICKGSGHNKSSCSQRAESIVGASNRNVASQQLVSTPSQQSSATIGKKRKFLSQSTSNTATHHDHAMSSYHGKMTRATADVTKAKGDNATVNLESNLQTSQSSTRITVQVSSGHVSIQGSTHEPAKKTTPRKRAGVVPNLHLAPKFQ